MDSPGTLLIAKPPCSAFLILLREPARLCKGPKTLPFPPDAALHLIGDHHRVGVWVRIFTQLDNGYCAVGKRADVARATLAMHELCCIRALDRPQSRWATGPCPRPAVLLRS